MERDLGLSGILDFHYGYLRSYEDIVICGRFALDKERKEGGEKYKQKQET